MMRAESRACLLASLFVSASAYMVFVKHPLDDEHNAGLDVQEDSSSSSAVSVASSAMLQTGQRRSDPCKQDNATEVALNQQGNARGADDIDVEAVCARWKDVAWGKCPKKNIHNLCDDLPSLCENARFRRCDMPQFPDYSGETSPDLKNTKNGSVELDAWGKWVAKLNQEGIHVDEKKATTVNELMTYGSSQTQLDSCKVCEILGDARKCNLTQGVPSAATCKGRVNGCFCSWSSGVHVSGVDHKILDGHHRWAVTKLLANDKKSFGTAANLAAFRMEAVNVLSYEGSVDKIRELSPVDANIDCGTYEKASIGENASIGGNASRILSDRSAAGDRSPILSCIAFAATFVISVSLS
jgi:hypothetical protein